MPSFSQLGRLPARLDRRPERRRLIPRLFAAVVFTACASPPPAQPRLEPAAKAREPAPAPTTPAESGTFDLPVPGFEPAIAVVPTGDRRLPLVIAAHGAGGDAEWQCRHWAPIVRERGIVLCPRGKRRSNVENLGWYYPDHLELDREFGAMLDAAKQRFGGRILPGAGIYVGFSQGATMGALMIVEHGGDFPYLLLIEGGSHEFSLARARRFRETGGKAAIFVCGVAHCANGATQMVQVLRRAGISAESEYVAHGGHTDDGAVGQRAAQRFEQLWTDATVRGQ